MRVAKAIDCLEGHGLVREAFHNVANIRVSGNYHTIRGRSERSKLISDDKLGHRIRRVFQNNGRLVATRYGIL